MTSHPSNSIGQQNAHILDTTTDAYRAALDLSERGFTVLEILVKDRQPMVRILGERRCEQLKGTYNIIRSGPGQRVLKMSTTHKGARIEWEERQ